MINRNDPLDMMALAFQPPGGSLILGSDNFGRDIFLELMYGIRTSVKVGLIAGICATVIGLFIGLASGYIGGLWDNILSTITNIFIVIPSFIILILVSVSINSRSSLVTALIIGITSWPWTARAVRAQTTSLRNRDHVNIAKISGHSTTRIIVFEILPYIASYVVMAFVLQTASGILSEASISMLGLGPYNTISLGILMNWALVFEAPVAGAWWAFIPAAFSIAIITFSLYMMNTGMDEIFNPKIRS
jgi:peptide/nickel transport system permease protein